MARLVDRLSRRNRCKDSAWGREAEPERDHIVAAFRFELGHVDHKEIRQAVVEQLKHVDHGLATAVSAGVGLLARAGIHVVRIADEEDGDAVIVENGLITTRTAADELADGFASQVLSALAGHRSWARSTAAISA